MKSSKTLDKWVELERIGSLSMEMVTARPSDPCERAFRFLKTGRVVGLLACG